MKITLLIILYLLTFQLSCSSDSDKPEEIKKPAIEEEPQILYLETGGKVKEQELSVRGTHSCVIIEKGIAYCWGLGTSGQLGQGDLSSKGKATKVKDLTELIAISAGGSHTCALKKDGTVWCWGLGTSGQLGNNETTTKLKPTKVDGLPEIVQISAGSNYTCALDKNGEAWCWGLGTSGQLGDNTTTTKLVPTKVSGLADIVTIQTGIYHTCAATSEKFLYCWGRGIEGQLGTEESAGKTEKLPKKVTTLINVVGVTLGAHHTCAMGATGLMYCWGLGKNGQLGHKDTPNNADTRELVPKRVEGMTNVESITSGFYHTCAKKKDTTMHCWGLSSNGQLGNGDLGQKNEPVKIETLSGATALSAGNYHTCAATQNGSVYCWGALINGKPAPNSTDKMLNPTKIQI